MTYGFSPSPKDDPYISIIEELVQTGAQVIQGGTYLVDVFPVLKNLPTWFPGTGFFALGYKIADLGQRSRNVLFDKSRLEASVLV
jgi:hypothetical protein